MTPHLRIAVLFILSASTIAWRTLIQGAPSHACSRLHSFGRGGAHRPLFSSASRARALRAATADGAQSQLRQTLTLQPQLLLELIRAGKPAEPNVEVDTFSGVELRALVKDKWGVDHEVCLRQTFVAPANATSVYLAVLWNAVDDPESSVVSEADYAAQLDVLAGLLVEWQRAPTFIASAIAQSPRAPRVTPTTVYNVALPLSLSQEQLEACGVLAPGGGLVTEDYVRPERRKASRDL